MNQKTKFNVIYIVIAIMGILMMRQVWLESQRVAVLPYNEFLDYAKQGKVTDLRISENQIEGKFLEPLNKKSDFITIRVDPDLAKELSQYNIKFSQVIENTIFRDLLSWIVPVFIFFGIWMFLMRRMGSKEGGFGGGFMSIGKSKAKVFVETDTKTTFKDAAGVDEAITELKETVEFLKDSKKFSRLGGRMPKGVLLVGPPGTGKTLLARAVAGEAGVPFFSISGSEFVEMFVGVGAARVRDLFEQARKQAPAIIFIDELDALGRARTASPMAGGHDEKEQTLNQLLVELDGFDSSVGIVILAATNRPEILDPALLRAGRFDRQVLVDRPDKKGRLDILKVHIKRVILSPDLDLEKIAALTPGFTGADLANLVNEAALMATRRNGENVNMDDFNAAVERIMAGLEKKNRILNDLERKVVAYHEMGHALVASSIPGMDPVHKVSIIPRGIGALGYTIQRPIEDRYLMTRPELENKMAVLLGGRAAELATFNQISTGAADDINRATDIARGMVTRYGMTTELGNVTYDTDSVGFLGTQSLSARKYSEATAREIDLSVKALVEKAYQKAQKILEVNKSVLESGAQLLLSKETLADAELQELFSKLIKNF